MAFQRWQVGLDIQNGQLCALGIQRCRNGWQLRHWWQHALPHDTLSHGVLQNSPALIALLQRWRLRLPRHLSLRVAFPVQAVLQRALPAPPGPLREPELGRYASAAAERLFPLAASELALDYRAGPQNRLCLTAARRSVVRQWQTILAQAGLIADALELSCGALAIVGAVMQLSAESALVHQLSDHWLWYQPGHAEAVTGWSPGRLTMNDEQLKQLLPAARHIWFSASPSAKLLTGMQALQPLGLLQLMHPPLPADAGMFTLALGLALRPEDVG